MKDESFPVSEFLPSREQLAAELRDVHIHARLLRRRTDMDSRYQEAASEDRTAPLGTLFWHLETCTIAEQAKAAWGDILPFVDAYSACKYHAAVCLIRTLHPFEAADFQWLLAINAANLDDGLSLEREIAEAERNDIAVRYSEWLAAPSVGSRTALSSRWAGHAEMVNAAADMIVEEASKALLASGCTDDRETFDSLYVR